MAGGSHSARDKYAKEARNPLQAHVHRVDKHPTMSTWWEPEDIVLTKADAKWVHHLHIDALFITVRMTNNNVQRMLVDNGSAADILY